ncbi:hypothetical protein Back2_27080 [Nocardioides baekrokdamisoli]|uniref:MaoC-like domain-containing protein n=1 Tax=Nocardioides baekrokdamisoli TaxID=1804624 RepID=A0A3G9IXJ7_9ACTN|nr:OB-fold domain-containing protein [Nocardioides baekrokdamisoli]BBH18421.1 hypothetical protein Back2_27080 [Nocardioides baekrokdamisoli]
MTSTAQDTTPHDDVMDLVAPMLERGPTEPRLALDEVNLPMIRHWLEAIGETDPRFSGPDAVAPPAMAQVWTMYGLDPHRPSHDPLHGTMQILDKAGFTSVLGTNCDQTYARFLLPGERTAITSRLTSVVGPKQTGVGTGYFVTTENTWWVGDEAVATMTFRVLKFKPGTAAAAAPKIDRTLAVRPVRNRDNEFFFEGAALGEVRIQKCNACGVLRHPPGPMCPSCHAADRGYVVASGLGTVFSEITHHAPAIPGRALPLRIVLVDLDEGVRMVGVHLGDEAPEIGTRVRAVFDRIDDDLTLVAWEPAASAETRQMSAETRQLSGRDAEIVTDLVVHDLPAWEVPITPTLVVSTALATRDFQDVHHDRDLAVKRGSKDIFLNILSTTGLVQRFVGEWARERFGADVRITACALRLGAPAYPGDTLTFTGDVVTDDGREVVVDVVGAVSLGNHVNARVTLVRGEA